MFIWLHWDQEHSFYLEKVAYDDQMYNFDFDYEWGFVFWLTNVLPKIIRFNIYNFEELIPL